MDITTESQPIGDDTKKEHAAVNDKAEEPATKEEESQPLPRVFSIPKNDETNGMLKITTWNVASLNARWEDNFLFYIKSSKPDIICIQETKYHKDHKKSLDSFKLQGYYGYFFNAEKKGYSGTAIYTKIKPLSVKKSFANNEGRCITMEFSNFFLMNTYVVNASEDLKRLDFKMNTFMPQIKKALETYRSKKSVIWTGDINIAVEDIDIWQPDGHDEVAGFTPQERAWLRDLFKEGYVDAFRYYHPESREYSFFNYRGNARFKNQGWRIDYFILGTGDLEKLGGEDCVIEGGVGGSDHQPVSLFLDRSKALTEKDISIDKTGIEIIGTPQGLLGFFGKK